VTSLEQIFKRYLALHREFLEQRSCHRTSSAATIRTYDHLDYAFSVAKVMQANEA